MSASAQVQLINKMISELPEEEKGLVSDGYHTFDEVYNSRAVLNAMAFNYLPKEFKTYKSLNHSNGLPCFEGKEWIIVGAQLPYGQISFHYPVKETTQFGIEEIPAAPVWDGHSTQDVIDRMRQFNVEVAKEISGDSS